MRKFYKFLMPLVAIVALALPTGVRAQSGNEISTFPWSCDFETASDNAVWTFSNASNGWYIGTATNNGGTHAMYVSENSGSTSSYSGSACVSYAYVTLDIASAGQYALQFDWKCNGESTYDFLRVAVASATTALPTSYSDWTSTSVPSNFMAVDGGSKLNLHSAWQTYSTEVAVPAAGLYRLIFVWRNDGSVYNQPPAAIDNVVVTELTCPRPTALTAIPSADHLDISWTAGGSETEWMVVVDDSIVDYAYTNSYTAINLQSNTLYNVKVYAICGSGDTSLATSDNFRTLCVAISTLPYQNDFEQEPHYTGTPYADAFPSCWTRINDATGTYNYYPYLYASSTYAHSGATGMYWYHTTSTTYANNEYAVLPPIDTTVIDMTDLTLAYYAKTTSTSYHPQMIVGVMTDPTDQSTFTPVFDFGANATTTDWQMFATSFANYTGYGNYIAIKVPRSSSTAYLAIDDIFLTDDWCNAPTDVQMVSSTTETITISWSPNGVSSFVVVLGSDTVTGVTDTFYTFTGLTANTAYSYGVAGECTSSLSFMVTGTAYTACIAIDSLPYQNDFEQEPHYSGTPYADAFPNCWTRINDATGTYNYYPYLYASSTYAHSGATGMYWYLSTTSTYANNEYAVLPPIDTTVIDMTDLTLVYYAKTTGSYNPQMIVGVMTDPTDQSTFTPVLDFGPNATTTEWQMFATSFANYTGYGNYIAIKVPRSSSTAYLAIDDILLTDDWCNSPMDVQSLATTDAVTLSWNPNGGSSFTVVLGTDTITGVTDTFYTFNGLTASTQYNYAVATECTSSLSFWVTGTTHTACEAIATLPYFQNFDGMAGSTATSSIPDGFLPPCWDRYNDGTRTSYQFAPYVYNSSTYSHSGSNCIRFYVYTTSGDSTQYLILPEVDSATYPINTMQLSFWLRGNSTSSTYRSDVIVGVMTNPTVESSFIPYDTILSAGTAYNYHEINFDRYSGPQGRITMMFPKPTASSSYEYGYLDDVKLDLIPACPPINSHSVVATAAAARLTWEAGIEYSGYTVNYALDSVGATTSVSVTSPTVTLTGLTADTTYYVTILPACSAGEVPYTFTFNTQALPCLEWDTTGYGGPADTIVVGAPGTSTSAVMPLNQSYNYSYCQHLILASELPVTGPQNFGGIAFDYAYTQPMTHATNCSIYMANTTRAIMDGTDSTFVPYSQLTLVYAGPLNCTTSGWNYFDFNSGVFAYDGTSNVIVAIVDNSGSSDGTSYTFRYQSTTNPMSHRVFGSTPYDSTEMDAARAGQSYWRSNMRFMMGGGSCISQASCYPPYVTARFDAAGDVQVDWIPGYQETSWNVDYRPGSTGSWTNFVTGTTAMTCTIPVDTLLTNTLYQFRVSPNCTDTVISGIASLTTPCGAIAALPYTEDFESASTGSSTNAAFVNCWTRINNGTSYFGYPYVSSSSTYNHTTGGTKGLYWYNTTTTGTYGDYQYIVFPPVNTTIYPVNTLQVSFWAKASSSSYNPVFEVGVMRTPDSVASFQSLGTINVGNSTNWQEYVAGLSSYTGTGRYVAIRALRPTSSWYAYVDDVTLELLPLCPRVENLMASNVLLNSATISWTDTSSNNTSWNIEYDSVPFTPGTGHMTPITVTDTFYNITGLDSGTVYHVYVYPVCGTDVFSRHITFTTLAAAPATVPYFCDFEAAGVNGWDLLNGSQANYWIVGGATSNGGTRSMYITNDGTNNSYSGSESKVFATRTFTLTDTGAYICTFDWKCQGESSYDFLRVALVPSGVQFTPGDYCGFNNGEAPSGTMPAGGIALDGSGRLNLQSSWQTRLTEFNLSTPGTYTLVFMWRNDGSVYNMPPAAIDNVGLMRNTCPSVSNIVVDTVTDAMATLHWTPGGTETEWAVTYGNNTVIVNTPSVTITGLSAMTSYAIGVRPVCSIGDTGFAATGRVTTEMCGNPIIAYSFDSTDIATTSDYSPIGYSFYNYGYVQTIIDSAKMAQLAGVDITAFGFNTTNTTAGDMYEGMTVYLANIPESSFTSDFIHPDANHVFVEVISNQSFSYTTTGWHVHAFDNTFTWDGHSNVLVSVKRDNGDYVSGATFAAHTISGGYKMIYDYNDDDPYAINTASGGTASNEVGDIRLISCGAGCPTPVISSVTNDYASATINVAGNDLGYELTYGTDPSNLGNPMTSTNGIFTIVGLTPATQYFFAVTQLCDSGVVSSPAMGTFTTDSLPCFDPSNVAVVNTTFNSAEIGWTSMGNATSWVISITAAGETRYDTVVTNPYTITNLYADQAYTVMVMALCGGGAAQSAWSEPYTFTTDPCTRVSGVTVTDITATSARVSWNAVQGSAGYRLYYGAPEFYEEEATQVEIASSATSYVINGLNPQTNYELYVRNRCTETLYSDVTTEDRVPFITLSSSEGIYDVESGTLTLYPNPASEKVTVTVSGFEGTVEVEIVDMNGRRVAGYTTMDSELTINVSDLAQGAYFVRVTGDTHTAVRKLIVK